MDIFKVKKIRDSKYCCVIFSLSYINPLESWGVIEQELFVKKLRGIVLIDLFVTNGVNNRFFSFEFNGSKINASSIKSVEAVSDELKKISSTFYCKHINLINKTTITNENLFKLKHCLII